MPSSPKASWSKKDHFGFRLLGTNHLRAFFFFVALLVPAVALAAGYAFSFVVVVNRASPVRVFGTNAYRYAGISYECVSFSNQARQPLIRVVFKFTYFDAAHELVGFDTLDRVGTVEPGASATWPGKIYHNPNCQHFEFPHQGIAINAVSVERVEMADGTTWTNSSPNVDTSPAESPEPALSPALTPAPWKTP
jgi:hypothetical protein